jgi:hypothetical protein
MIDDIKREINFVRDWLDEWIVQDPQGVLKWDELKTRRSADIKAFFKNGEKKLIDSISSMDEGGCGELWGHKHSNRGLRLKEYTAPDGTKHKGVWAGWRFKTAEEMGQEEGVSSAFGDD